jgi:hypothetical protein
MHSSTESSSKIPTHSFPVISHEVEGKLTIREWFHPSKLRLKRGRKRVRVWAGVGREEIEEVSVPLRPDVSDVVEGIVVFRRNDMLRLQHVPYQIVRLRFYLGLDRVGNGGSLLCWADIPRLSWSCHRRHSFGFALLLNRRLTRSQTGIP